MIPYLKQACGYRFAATMLFLLVFLYTPSAGMSAVAYMSFDQLLTDADIIVTGTVTAVSADRFDLLVACSLRGSLEPGITTTALQFRNWICASRWAPYATGQEAVFFLRSATPAELRSRHGSDTSEVTTSDLQLLVPMGGANEGEMPIANGSVIVPGSTVYHGLFGASRGEIATWTISGHKFAGASISWDVFLEAVLRREQFREEVFAVLGRLSPSAVYNLLTLCHPFRQVSADLSRLAERSPVHAAIVDGVIRETRALSQEKH